MSEESDLTEFGGRFRWALEHAGTSQAALARDFCVSRQTIHGWASRADPPSEDTVKRLAGATGVTREWLRYGVGHPVHGCVRGDEAGDGAVVLDDFALRMTEALHEVRQALGAGAGSVVKRLTNDEMATLMQELAAAAASLEDGEAERVEAGLRELEGSLAALLKAARET